MSLWSRYTLILTEETPAMGFYDKKDQCRVLVEQRESGAKAKHIRDRKKGNEEAYIVHGHVTRNPGTD